MANTTIIPGDLHVQGKIITDGEINANGAINIIVNDQGAMTAVDGYGNVLSILNVDASGTIVFGPGHDKMNRFIQYIPSNLEHREILWNGWNATAANPPAGFNFTSIGAGYDIAYLDTGATRLTTKNGQDDGVRIKFGNLYTTTNRRTNLWGMFNTESNSYIDLQFGFMASYGPAVYFRYISGLNGNEWVCTTNNGSGNISHKYFTNQNDATFRRQFQISWENGYGSGINTPSDIAFLMGDSNNEFTIRHDHTSASGSLPSVSEKLTPYLQFRTQGNLNKVLLLDHVWGWFER